jgi:hypothetical protein
MGKLTAAERDDLEAWDSRDDRLEDCWNCGGEGFVAHCEDEGACLYPEDGCDFCTRRCEYCAPAPKTPPNNL